MKILLILPADDDWRIKAPNAPVPKRAMLRFSVLGLTIVAALTPGDHEVSLIDENVEFLDLEQPADVVGISFMTGLAPRAYEIAERFNQRGAVTVAGGFHPTLNPEEASEHFDIVASGQAEGTWRQILRDIQAGTFKHFYHSLPDKELSQTPVPRREFFKQSGKHYITTHAIETGRGCRHRCKFCSITAFYKHCHHKRPLDEVIKEVRDTPKHFMFIDDNIIADPEYAKRLFREMISLKKRWISQCSIMLADDEELLSLAYRAGCRGVFIGIESISEKNLEAMEKGFNDSRSYYDRIRRIRNHGIAVQAGMIVGLDNDDTTVFENSLKFLQQTGIGALQLAILTPQPGTPLHEEFKKNGRIISYEWRKYDYRHCVISPKKMTPQQLQSGADWLYAQFYRIDRILARSLKIALNEGLLAAWLSLRLGITYRYSIIKEGRHGINPARARKHLISQPAAPVIATQ